MNNTDCLALPFQIKDTWVVGDEGPGKGGFHGEKVVLFKIDLFIDALKVKLIIIEGIVVAGSIDKIYYKSIHVSLIGILRSK